jgi:hypothetical protein
MLEVKVDREKLYKLMLDQNGRFFSVVFRKKDGSLRIMNGRLGVKKYLRGGVNKVSRYDTPYITVFECISLGYRTANLQTITKVMANNTIYTIKEVVNER